MGQANSKEELLEAIRQNKKNEVKRILKKYPELKNACINQKNDHTSLCMAAYYGCIIATKELIEVTYNKYFLLLIIIGGA